MRGDVSLTYVPARFSQKLKSCCCRRQRLMLMPTRRALLICNVCLLCVAGIFSSARGQSGGQAFNPGMSLEETVTWLGKQLTHQKTVVSRDGKSQWHRGTSLVKAKGCTLSYWSTLETEDTQTWDAVSPGSQTRELWVLNLSGLDPDKIRVGASNRIRFEAAASSRYAIRTTLFKPLFHNDRDVSEYSNKRSGYFLKHPCRYGRGA